ncbi:hypothetical protein F2Q68_00005412 [Brassica cretica]|uniref:Uncharacterized protein n=1 Tax=Brassica cretica TaxID=69181 RepID=A0A8S9J9J0_BRACR|nr:hypothetical protein F2Q68_00005412 [Brassica cretica]
MEGLGLVRCSATPDFTALQRTDPNPSPWEKTPPHPPVVFAKSRRTSASSKLAGEIVGVVESRWRNRQNRRISPEKSSESNLVDRKV